MFSIEKCLLYNGCCPKPNQLKKECWVTKYEPYRRFSPRVRVLGKDQKLIRIILDQIIQTGPKHKASADRIGVTVTCGPNTDLTSILDQQHEFTSEEVNKQTNPPTIVHPILGNIHPCNALRSPLSRPLVTPTLPTLRPGMTETPSACRHAMARPVPSATVTSAASIPRPMIASAAPIPSPIITLAPSVTKSAMISASSASKPQTISPAIPIIRQNQFATLSGSSVIPGRNIQPINLPGPVIPCVANMERMVNPLERIFYPMKHLHTQISQPRPMMVNFPVGPMITPNIPGMIALRQNQIPGVNLITMHLNK